ncbi:DUF418 domain-containing protein [Nocardia panacis]|uniref:DUF418 domain-containing protein n=1 Tax=Nocardia panacis TaxID=2340916 RepID=UPI003F72DBF2
MTAAEPRVASPRLVALDVLRGIAILGTLGTNIWIITDLGGMIGYLHEVNAAPAAGWMWVERVLEQVTQGKFLGLLTVMFGIGLAIQQGSALRAGRAWPGGYPWRAGLLFLDGLLNFLFIAEFDVLMGYAVTGLVVACILARSDRAQWRWLIGTAAAHLTVLTVIALGMIFAPRAGGSAGAPDPNPYADGSFWDLVVFRVQNLGTFRFEPIFIAAMSVALFLTGARLYRAGVFRPEGARIRKRLMVIGFGIAAPLDLLVGVLGGGDAMVFTRYGTAPLVSLGLLSLVAQFYLHRPSVGFVGRRLTEVGRTALSCYILQNLVASILCYGWGFGLAARVSPDARVPFTVGIYLVTAAIIGAAAHLWLRRFERGPVEWMWNLSYRALTRER